MKSNRQDVCTSLGLLILRLGIGGYMLTHGWGKLQMLRQQQFAEFGDPLGIGAGLSLVLVVVAEFVAALLVMLGLVTRLAALFPVGAMAVAAFVVHANDPWVMGAGGASKEPALLYLIPFLALVFTGAGCFSLDRLLFKRRPTAPDKP